ncbi:recombinase family protein [Swaminathania salitolerans]|uniref:Resolvase/invertase-type recombinase catalytic domain-containing protein n=1 Tax=Swaminathania salitolerans TaxID=182838 RepID=A0A511BT45_9PROT|nr:recombinase family protein [Swaminathania salitolerans]GBQ13294.1 hypothetical protein AA21291_1459 [Swaminathania salitolerans LMG 21291]GEL03272.1 hypothetical protein SSA02_24350 [Swaminathania salitolerans]
MTTVLVRLTLPRPMSASHARHASAVRIPDPDIDTSGAGGKLFLLLLAGFAEFERNIIRERALSARTMSKLVHASKMTAWRAMNSRKSHHKPRLMIARRSLEPCN